MDFQDVLRKRRSVRAYLPDEVPPETLARIVDTARRAPSAGFSQGIDFLVLSDSRALERFWTLTSDPEHGAQIEEDHPPAVVLVFSDPLRYLARYSQGDKIEFGLDDLDRWPVRFWDVDAAMAAMQLQLVAANEGLGTWFFGIGYGEDEVRQEFSVPEDRRLVGVIALGYPKPDEVRKGSGISKRRRPLEAQLHTNGW
jgi:nitroreductase